MEIGFVSLYRIMNWHGSLFLIKIESILMKSNESYVGVKTTNRKSKRETTNWLVQQTPSIQSSPSTVYTSSIETNCVASSGVESNSSTIELHLSLLRETAQNYYDHFDSQINTVQWRQRQSISRNSSSTLLSRTSMMKTHWWQYRNQLHQLLRQRQRQ